MGIVVINQVQYFSDDFSYLIWLQNHSSGFVLNLRRRRDPNYVVLHRANCRTICRRPQAAGAYTERDYRKVAAQHLDALREAARAEGRTDGSFSKTCTRCDPLGHGCRR